MVEDALFHKVQRDLDSCRDELARARIENDRMRSALEFYADGSNDCGDLALVALACCRFRVKNR